MADRVPRGPWRGRRMRRTAALREWTAERGLEARRLVYPLFIRPGTGPREPIESLPGVDRLPLSEVSSVVGSAQRQGVSSFLLFGLPRKKTPDGREAYARNSAVVKALQTIRRTTSQAVLVTDICLCAYTTHGHCGILQGHDVDNDATVDALGRMAVAHAEAGADLVAPSAMMDHQVAGIRSALDDAGFASVGILGYGAKFASAYYGPFREASESTPSFGDRKSYQLDDRNARTALRHIVETAEEGADVVLVKPALPCLDIIAEARDRLDVPVAAYQVSGEYAMIKLAARQGWVSEPAAAMESLRAIHRAGADLIVTYFAPHVSGWMHDSEVSKT